jgi:hypothetical protein
MLAIGQGQKRIRRVELAKYLQQRLNLRNVAPERQKTTLGAFCSQDKESKKANLRSSARESRKQEQISPVYSLLATRPRLLWWPAAAPVIAVTAALSSRDQRHGVRYVTSSCECAGSHLLRLVFSCNTKSNLHHTKMFRGTVVK